MSNRARQHIIVLITACAILLSGCPPPLGYVVLYNNSGSDYEVLLSERRVRWRAGSSLRIYEDAHRSARDIDWEELLWQHFFTLRLESSSRSASYRWSMQPRFESAKEERGVYAQLEPDGLICQVPLGSRFPGKRLAKHACIERTSERSHACAGSPCKGSTRVAPYPPSAEASNAENPIEAARAMRSAKRRKPRRRSSSRVRSTSTAITTRSPQRSRSAAGTFLLHRPSPRIARRLRMRPRRRAARCTARCPSDRTPTRLRTCRPTRDP